MKSDEGLGKTEMLSSKSSLTDTPLSTILVNFFQVSAFSYSDLHPNGTYNVPCSYVSDVNVDELFKIMQSGGVVAPQKTSLIVTLEQKAYIPMLLTELPILTEDMLVDKKAKSPIDCNVSGRETVVKAQSRKACSPIETNESPKSTYSRVVQRQNAAEGMVFKELGIDTYFKQ